MPVATFPGERRRRAGRGVMLGGLPGRLVMVSAGRLQLSLGLLGAGLVGGAKRLPAIAISASQCRTQLDLWVQLAGLEQC